MMNNLQQADREWLVKLLTDEANRVGDVEITQRARRILLALDAPLPAPTKYELRIANMALTGQAA